MKLQPVGCIQREKCLQRFPRLEAILIYLRRCFLLAQENIIHRLLLLMQCWLLRPSVIFYWRNNSPTYEPPPSCPCHRYTCANSQQNRQLNCYPWSCSCIKAYPQSFCSLCLIKSLYANCVKSLAFGTSSGGGARRSSAAFHLWSLIN